MQMRCFKFLVVLCCAVCTGLQSYGQSGLPYNQIPQNNTWIFGTGAGMDFNAATPVATSSNNEEGTLGPKVASGTAVASDDLGQLLLYSQLDTIWDRNNNIMPNGAGLVNPLPAIAASSAAYFDGASLIVPFPGDLNKYFVFSQTSLATTSAVANIASVYGGNDPMAGRLFYSLVDMSLNGGLGDVVAGQKGIQIDSMLCDRLVAVTGKNCNIWVLCMKNDGSAMHAFEVSAAGVNHSPVISPCAVTTGASAVNISPLFQMPGGCMRSSGDGSKLAVSLSGVVLELSLTPFALNFYGGNFQLYDFDILTGVASNQVNVMPVSNLLTLDQQIFSLSFSPDNSKIYTPHGLLIGTGVSQFDISSGVAATIVASRTEINPTGDIGSLTSVRLGPDGKIYIPGVSIAGLLPGNTLHRIDNPDAAGLGATLTLNAVTLTPGALSSFGLGNATVERPPTDTTFNSQTLALCAPDPSLGLSVPLDPAYTYLWDDGSSSNTRTVTGGGKYWVMYGPYCPKIIDTFIVDDIDLRFDLGNDSVICGTIFPFDLKGPDEPGAAYLWQDGSTTPVYRVSTGGTYSLTVSKMDCTASDDIKIDAFDVFQDLGKDTTVCAKTPFSIRLDANVPDGAAVLWSTGATTPEIYVSAPGTYGVRVSQDVCVGIDSIKISNTELCDCISFMPTAFSPNSDGLNDIFIPVLEKGCKVSGYNFNIFNRWGERVFSSVKPGTGWDGTYKGVVADAGTYMFTISFEKGTHYNVYALKGDVVLVR